MNWRSRATIGLQHWRCDFVAGTTRFAVAFHCIVYILGARNWMLDR